MDGVNHGWRRQKKMSYPCSSMVKPLLLISEVSVANLLIFFRHYPSTNERDAEH